MPSAPPPPPPPPPSGPSNNVGFIAGSPASPTADKKAVGNKDGQSITHTSSELAIPPKSDDGHTREQDETPKSVASVEGQRILGKESEDQAVDFAGMDLAGLLNPTGPLAKNYQKRAEKNYINKSQEVLKSLLDSTNWDSDHCFESYKQLSGQLIAQFKDLNISVTVSPYGTVSLIPPDDSLSVNQHFRELVQLSLDLTKGLQVLRKCNGEVDGKEYESEIKKGEGKFNSLMQNLDPKTQQGALTELAKLKKPEVCIGVSWQELWPGGKQGASGSSDDFKPDLSRLDLSNNAGKDLDDSGIKADERSNKDIKQAKFHMVEGAGQLTESQREQVEDRTRNIGRIGAQITNRPKHVPGMPSPHSRPGGVTPSDRQNPSEPFEVEPQDPAQASPESDDESSVYYGAVDYHGTNGFQPDNRERNAEGLSEADDKSLTDAPPKYDHIDSSRQLYPSQPTNLLEMDEIQQKSFVTNQLWKDLNDYQLALLYRKFGNAIIPKANYKTIDKVSRQVLALVDEQNVRFPTFRGLINKHYREITSEGGDTTYTQGERFSPVQQVRNASGSGRVSKGKLIPFELEYNRDSEGDSIKQAEAILNKALEVIDQNSQNPIPGVAITYSANHDQTQKILRVYKSGGWKTDTGGSNQARVMAEMEKLLQGEKYKGLKYRVRIAPISTINHAGDSSIVGNAEVNVCLKNLEQLIQKGWHVLGWKNQDSSEDSPFAIGGGVSGNFRKTPESSRIQQKLIELSMVTMDREDIHYDESDNVSEHSSTSASTDSTGITVIESNKKEKTEQTEVNSFVSIENDDAKSRTEKRPASPLESTASTASTASTSTLIPLPVQKIEVADDGACLFRALFAYHTGEYKWVSKTLAPKDKILEMIKENGMEKLIVSAIKSGINKFIELEVTKDVQSTVTGKVKEKPGADIAQQIFDRTIANGEFTHWSFHGLAGALNIEERVKAGADAPYAEDLSILADCIFAGLLTELNVPVSDGSDPGIHRQENHYDLVTPYGYLTSDV